MKNNFSNPSTLYPTVGGDGNAETRHSTTDLDKKYTGVNSFTIKAPLNGTIKGIEGVPFKLNPKYENANKKAVSINNFLISTVQFLPFEDALK